jgi:hypothetical protein
MKYSKFLAATIEAHRVISEEHLVEAFDWIICFKEGQKAMVVRRTHLSSEAVKTKFGSK